MSGSFFPARSPPSVGLDNTGNSCYLSSVVQSLYLTDTFRSHILALRLTPAEMKQFGTLRALQHTFAMLHYCTRDHYNPRAFACEMPTRFNSGQQQDADEYAKYLLDLVSASVVQLVKQRQAAVKRKVEDIAAEPSQREEKKCDVKRDSPKEERKEAAQEHGKIRGGAQPLAAHTFAHVNGTLPAAIIHRNMMAPSAHASTASTVLPALSAASPISSTSSAQLPFSPPPPSPLDVDTYFGGLSSSCIACLRCGCVSKKDEAFLELPLPMEQMDDEQRCALMDRITQVTEAVQSGQTHEIDTQEDAVMRTEESMQQLSAEATDLSSSAPALPLAVLAKIAAFSTPLQTTNKALRSATTSTSFSHPAHSSKPMRTPTFTPAERSSVSLHTSAAAGGGSRELPLDVLARIAEFAAVRPKLQSTAATTTHQQAISQPHSQTVQGASLNHSSHSPSMAGVSSGDTSSMQDSSAPSLLSSSSASISLPASSFHSSSSANALLASFLAQAVLQMQAIAAVTALTTVAAAAQKVREEQLEAEVDKDERKESSMEIDDDRSRGKSHEDECTAVVVYAPPPHKPHSPSNSLIADSKADSTSSTSTALILAPSTQASSSSSTSATPSSLSLLQLSAMLALYLAPELLTGENAYHCSHCHSKQPATKTLTITQPPPHLMLCLKRNSYNKSTHSRNKITTEVKFPALLTLPLALSATAGSPASAVYCLYSVVVHGGMSADSGHYYAIGRWSGELRRRMRAELQQRVSDSDADRKATAGDWLRFERELEESARGGEFWTMNDSTVMSASFTTIAQLTKRSATDVAYLLLYVRVDDDDAVGGGGGGESEALTVNPLLERLAAMEQQIWVKQQEKAAREALASVMQRLPKLPDYTPPPADYVDPDM